MEIETETFAHVNARIYTVTHVPKVGRVQSTTPFVIIQQSHAKHGRSHKYGARYRFHTFRAYSVKAQSLTLALTHEH